MSCSFAQTKSALNLVPVPVQMKVNGGQFVINSNTQIVQTVQSQEMENAVAVFNGLLRKAAGYRLAVVNSPVSLKVINCR